MPTYEYKCKKCKSVFEVEQKMADDAFKIHDINADPDSNNCGGDLSKIYSSVGIVWKGSGFYKTDTRSGTSSTAKTTRDNSNNSSTSDTSSRSDSPIPSESGKSEKTKDSKSISKEKKSSKSPAGENK
jgi:putative FmdB family regulatory protein